MTDEVKQEIQKILDSSDEEKANLAKGALSSMLNGLMSHGLTEEQVPGFIVSFTRLFVCIDKHCSTKEYEFFKAVSGIDKMTFKEFYEMTSDNYNEEFLNGILGYYHNLTPEEKNAGIYYGIAVLSSDNVVTYQELSLIDFLLQN